MNEWLQMLIGVGFLIIITACGNSVAPSPDVPVERMQTFSVFDDNWNMERKIRIYLPQSYNDGVASYPVLYMVDGENIFAPGGAFGSWNLEEVYDGLVNEGIIEEVIIVAVHNVTDSSRSHDFSPVSWDEGPLLNPVLQAALGGSRGGGAPQFISFLENTLLPKINSEYRTKTGSLNTAIGGSSFGGMFALYASHTRADLFGKAGVFSPGVFWGQWEWFYNTYLASNNPQDDVVYYLSAGNDENNFLPEELITLLGNDRFKKDEDNDLNGLCFMAEDAYGIANALVDRGWTYGENLFFTIDYEGVHSENSWNKRAGEMLTFFYNSEGVGQCVDIELYPTREVVDSDESSPRFTFFVEAVHENGMQGIIPYGSGFLLYSDNDVLWRWSDNDWDLLDRWNILMNKDNMEYSCQVHFGVSYGDLTGDERVVQFDL